MIWPLGNMHVLMFQAIKPFHIPRFRRMQWCGHGLDDGWVCKVGGGCWALRAWREGVWGTSLLSLTLGDVFGSGTRTLLLNAYTQRVKTRAKRAGKVLISRSITFKKTGGIKITPADSNRMRIVVKDRACIRLHDLPAAACLNSIQEA